MNPSPPRRPVLFPISLLLLALTLWTRPATAQVGAALVAVPWQPGKSLSATNYFLGLQTESEGPGFDTDLSRAVSYGRFRFDTEDPDAVSFGWLYDHTKISSSDPLLPERLVTTAFAAGMGLGEVVEGWDVGFSVGGGFSGDKPFADEDAWYGVGSVYARKQIDRRTSLTLILDYDGSRAIFPDIPLPGIQYSVFESPSLRYSLGLPFSTLHYQPADRWTIDVQYALPIGGHANVEFKIDDQWAAYGSFTTTTRGYHLDGDNEHRRIFFEQDRLELGTRFNSAKGWTWTFAGGWAFNQEFTRGFDVRDDTRIRQLDDAPYLRIGLNASF